MAVNYYDSFVKKLEEIFMMDHAELDFGIYRIMNQKRQEIQRFLEKELLPQVTQILTEAGAGDTNALRARMKEIEVQAASFGASPEGNPEYQQLKTKVEQTSDTAALQNDVFSHLVTFFSRYYDNGDFVSKRRYKDNTYAIPYNGEEVKLHWANADQYYIKSSEYFRDYTFVLPESRRKVHFVLKDATTEQNNNKAANNMERRFAIFKSEEEPFYEQQGDELNIYFTYELMPKATKQDALLAEAFDTIKAVVTEAFMELLTTKMPTAKDANRTLLEKHLTDYTAKNSFDYFIHKDLGGFLRRELDFYIKNEVMHLDDLDTEHIQNQLIIIKAIKQVGEKIIRMLAQLENFQKRLWLKKKFVVQSDYCITLDRVPEELYADICANDRQREEWVRLFAIDEIEGLMGVGGYSEPLTEEFLRQNPFLVLDTAFFSPQFKHKLVSHLGDKGIDEQCNGLLMFSDNFHANRLLLNKYSDRISSTFIDPPYNTGDNDFVYKDNFKSSSWLSMIDDRLDNGMNLIKDSGVMFITIGDEEQEHLSTLITEKYGKENFFSTLIWEKKKKGSFLNGNIAKMKDYVLCVAKNTFGFNGLIGEITSEEETYPCVNADNGRDIRTISTTIPSKFREKNYTLKSGNVISAGNMNIVLHSDLIISNGFLVPPLVVEGNWRYKQDSMDDFANAGDLYLTQDLYLRRIVRSPRHKRLKDLLLRISSNEEESDFRKIEINNLNLHGWGSNEDANEELLQIIGEQYSVSYPKPSKLIAKLFASTRLEEGIYMDYFAGSATTGQSIITLNRLDRVNRKYILVDMGPYFFSVGFPRIQKAIYSPDWKDGKPVSRQGISQCFKYLRLEQYEDTLNNLELNETQQALGNFEEGSHFKESYMLSYMLDTETRDSLLNLKMFENPFAMTLKTTKDNELVPTQVDMVETFNYLIGLNVETENWYRQDNICVVTGRTHRDNLRTLVIWRNCKEINNNDLNAFFERMDFRTRDSEFDVIYVNGDNTLPNLKRDEEHWRVVLTEEEFAKRMFEND